MNNYRRNQDDQNYPTNVRKTLIQRVMEANHANDGEVYQSFIVLSKILSNSSAVIKMVLQASCNE